MAERKKKKKKKTTAKGKRRSGNNRRTKQSKQPNVNSSEAKLTRNSKENAKMQANHIKSKQESSRRANKKWTRKLTLSHVSQLRIRTVLSISHEKFGNRPIES